MSEYDDLLPDEVTPESKDAHLEEKVEHIGDRPVRHDAPRSVGPSESGTASSSNAEPAPETVTAGRGLGDDVPLPPDLPSVLPVSDVEDDPSAPAFVVLKNAYGPGVPSVRLANGTPVGVWLKNEYPDLSGAEVEDLVARMGMEEVLPGHSAKLGRWRDGAITARRELAGMPAVTEFAHAERLHEEQTASMRKAFVEAKKKEKK